VARRAISAQRSLVDVSQSVEDHGPVNAECRLVAYGTLAPGRPNHHQLDGLKGRWLKGTVHGELVQQGWGAALGFPALVLDPDGPAVNVQIFESSDLPSHWPRLDHFEGPGYKRVAVPVDTASGRLEASIYVVKPDSAPEEPP
jgi:gamma-glutamylcyclotransferase (GGCT)/AIG2-like uncharacterized protein YtfP